MNTNGVTALDALRHNNEASVERLVPSSSAELLGSSRFTYCLASTLAMAPRPAPLQRYATAAIHPTDSSEKPAMKSRSRSVMPAKARSVSIELSDALAPLGSQLDGVVAPRMTGGGIF